MTCKRSKIAYILILLAVAAFFAMLLLCSLSYTGVTARAAEPEQTYNIYSGSAFVAYARAYASGERNPKDVLNISISSGSDITDDTFISLGTAARPFAGTIFISAAGIDTFRLYNCPLFDYVSTDMSIKGAGTVKIIRERASLTPGVGVLTSGAAFANHVVAGSTAASWRVALLPYSGEGSAATDHVGLIGDIEGGANVSITLTDTSALAVSGEGNVGLICGDLGAGASLTVTTSGSGESRTLTSTSGNAGGLVGRMRNGASLTLASANNTRLSSVTGASYAGGLVGYAENPVITWSGISSYDLTSSVSGASGAGGIFGYYKTTAESETFSMEKYAPSAGLEVSSTNFAGGVFGYLDSQCASLSFDGEASNARSFSFTLSAGKGRGGIAGKYRANALTQSYEIENLDIAITATAANDQYSAGLIGRISDDAAYLLIHDVEVSSSGSPTAGLIGYMGEGGSFANVTDVTISGTYDGGLVGWMPQGVLRIQGDTDFSAFAQSSSSTGLIVRSRGRALVYALGDGEGTGWTLKRNLQNAIDDVGGWGEVLRVDGTRLSESDLFTVDISTQHTVTVNAASTSIGTITGFALTALNIQLNTADAIGALQFTSGNANKSATLLAGSLTLTENISLAGTGLTGFTRDDGGNAAFSGTFDGGSKVLTLAIGERYGLNGSGAALSADSKQGNIYRHAYNGLFAKIGGGASVSNLTISGSMVIYQSVDDTIYAGALAAYCMGTLTISSLTVDVTLTYKTMGDYSFSFGGALGTALNSSLSVSVTDSDIHPIVTDITESSKTARTNNASMGGVIGRLTIGNTSSPSQSVSITDSSVGLTYTKTINTARESVFGGVIAQIGNAAYVKDRRRVSIDNVELSVTATGTAAGDRFGGLLGTDWYACDVTIDGLTVTATVTATGPQTSFGGLTARATGKWNIVDISLTSASYTLPSNSSTFGFVTNKTYVSTSISGSTAESALYLDVNDSAYDISALTFTTNPAFSAYDELVASSIAKGANITKNGNSIISVTTSNTGLFDTSGTGYTTYLNQTAYGRTNAGAVNPNARYYYNLAYARANTSTAKFKFLVWSVRQYAHESLSAWFSTDNAFTGTLNMTGLSYYPIDFSGTVSFSSVTIVLDNNLTESSVHYAYLYEDNGSQYSTARTTRSGTNQHYLMHTALFRDVVGTMTISTATLEGNVPKLSDSFCGFLIAGKAGGSDHDKVKLTLSSLIFSGVYVSNAGEKYTDTTYAPLAINTIGKNSVLDLNGASGAAYTSYSSGGYYAGSSLIGDVGDDTARAIYLTFTGIAFDSRTSATSIDNFDTAYSTYKTIFSRAMILNSFLYFSEGSATYNFTLAEDRTSAVTATHAVTYGQEITSSGEHAGNQKKYYGSEYYVHPTDYESTSEYSFASGFRPYVFVAYNLSEYKHEIAVNVTFTSVIAGSGKYGDPYVIDNDDKLPIISSIIAGGDVGSTVQLYLPTDLTNYDYTTYAEKNLYNFDTTTMTSSDGGTARSTTYVRRYLAGAYYVITRDITLPSSYKSLGEADSAEYAFRGVIVGSGNPVVTNQSPSPLIHTSNGCVVKGITIDVDVDYASSNTITLAAPTGSATYAYNNGIQSYGAVIGQVLGGDTIIDGVQVTFTDASFSVTSASSSCYPRLTAIGGYIGALVNGGVIFRNMTAANVGLTAAVYDKIADAGYLYVNPIIGRVIAGYAFHESATYHATESDCTLKNGTKNYTISDLSLSEAKLGVTYSSSTYTVTVPNGQAMYVLGAIVNSGAASASYHVSDVNAYEGLDAFWSAYRAHTTARGGAAYTYVGESGFASASDYTDYAVYDTYTSTGAKIPYIIRAYTTKSGSAYLARCICTSDQVAVVVTGNSDVAGGFRGIGSIYYNSTYLRLRIKSMTGRVGETTGSYKITLHMRYLEYNHVYVSNYIAIASTSTNDGTAGFGLFNRLNITSASESNCVQYLELAGSIFYDVYKLTGEGGQADYNFAPFKDNDRSEAKDIKNDKNTEDATMRRTILSVGGIAGYVNDKCYIKNVTFNNFSVEGAKYAGGIVGFLYTNVSTDTRRCVIAYDDASVTNAGYVNVVGGQCAGGIIGRIYKSAAQISGASDGTDIIVKTIESKDTDPNEVGLTYFANLNTGVGGIIGNCWGSDKVGYAYPASLASASFDNKAQNELIISNINVVKGNEDATIRVKYDRNGDKDDRYNYAGGFVGAAHYVYLKISNSNVRCVNVSANAAGGFVGKMTQHYYLEVFNCTANGCVSEDGTTKDATITGTRHAGGMIAWVVGRDKIYFQLLGFVVKNYTVESYTRKNSVIAGAGGAVGYAEGNNVSVSEARNVICQFNNLTILNCDIKSNYTNKTDNYLKYKCGTGGIIGVIDALNNSDGKGDPNESGRVESLSSTSNKYKFSGYNILVKDCTFTHLNGGSSDDSTSATNRRIGDIVGNNAVSTTIKFVGVSVQNNNYCGKHVGTYNSDEDNYGSDGTFGTGYLVLANYSGITTNTSFAGIADNTLAVDNYTDVSVAAPYVTANPGLNIGGMTLTGDGVAATVENLPIQNIITDGASGRYGYAVKAYYNGASGDTNLQAFSAYTAKLSMFTSEVSGYLGTDFPVLIVDDTTSANSHKMINSYLRLLTNTVHDFGTDGAGIYSVFIYQVTYSDGTFTPHATGASLKRADGAFYITNSAFDSGKTQFSLIDLRFFDPAEPSKVAYHVYVPIFVKKVLSYSFDIAVQSGTNYLESRYTSKFGEALIENVGTPVTLYFRYTYSRTSSEWATAINLGEDIHRNYEKTLLLYKANTNEILKTFPSDAVLVLVDRNRGGKVYYASIGTALSGNVLDLSVFRETMSTAGVFGGSAFSPVNLESMMSLSVTQAGGGADKMVACALGSATVVVNGQGYRLATTEELADGSVEKYTVSVADVSFTEDYYLSVFTKSNAVNDLLFHYYLITTPSSFGDVEHPSKILDTGEHTMVHLVMGKIFYHDDLTVNGDSLLGSQVMTAENHELIVTLSAVLGLSEDLDEDIRTNVRTLIGATDVYQSFLVYLNRKEGSSVLRAIIGDPTADAEYAIDYVLNGEADVATSSYAPSNIRLTQNHIEVVTPDISGQFSLAEKFEINATITLSYSATAIPTQFPGRGIGSPDSGVTISASSNIAFSSAGTTYSKNTISQDETPAVSYYSEADPVVALLDLNAIGDKVGDFTSLGINALNNGNATTATFDLLAVIDATAVEDQIVGYTSVEMSVKLQQKGSDGTYGDPLDISEYLTVAINGEDVFTDNDTAYTLVLASDHAGIDDNGAEITLPIMHFSIKTGSVFEAAGLTYSNYRIVVETVLYNSQGEISSTKVSNYIVYTNAKIVPTFVG